MADGLHRLKGRILLLEYSFGNDLAQYPVQAENTDENLEIQVSGQVAESVFSVQLIGNQDGIRACADGEKDDSDKKNIIHGPGSHLSF